MFYGFLFSFQESLNIIYELNRDRLTEHSAVYGLTAYSDLSKDEFLHLYLQPRLPEHLNVMKQKQRHYSHKYYNAVNERAVVDGLPLRVDW
jgi:hypothetical protein